MGCDIHPSIEVRRNGRWMFHRGTAPCRYYYEIDFSKPGAFAYGHDAKRDADGDPIRSKYGDRCKWNLPDYFFDRNYTTFALLANVRNYDYDPPLNPISDPRGLPPGVHPQTIHRLSQEHSETWVTLRELQEHDYSYVIDDQYGERFVLEETRIPQMIEYLTTLIPKGGTPDDVRLVMDFDS